MLCYMSKDMCPVDLHDREMRTSGDALLCLICKEMCPVDLHDSGCDVMS